MVRATWFWVKMAGDPVKKQSLSSFPYVFYFSRNL